MAKRTQDERLEFVLIREGDRVRVQSFYYNNGSLASAGAPWSRRIPAEVLTPQFLSALLDERQQIINRVKLAADQLALF